MWCDIWKEVEYDDDVRAYTLSCSLKCLCSFISVRHTHTQQLQNYLQFG